MWVCYGVGVGVCFRLRLCGLGREIGGGGGVLDLRGCVGFVLWEWMVVEEILGLWFEVGGFGFLIVCFWGCWLFFFFRVVVVFGDLLWYGFKLLLWEFWLFGFVGLGWVGVSLWVGVVFGGWVGGEVFIVWFVGWVWWRGCLCSIFIVGWSLGCCFVFFWDCLVGVVGVEGCCVCCC